MAEQSDKKESEKIKPGPVIRSNKRRYTAEIDHVDSDSQAVALIELDSNGFITEWSREAELLYGYDFDEIVGKHVSSLYCGGELEQGRAAYELNAMATRRAYNVFGWQQRKGGQQFWTYSETSRTGSGYRLQVKEVPRVESGKQESE